MNSNNLETKTDVGIIANAALGSGLSGGDRIFIELARKWGARGHNVNIFVWEEGYEMCKRNGLEDVKYTVWSALKYRESGFVILYLVRIIKGCIEALRMKKPLALTTIYSASDFLPDSLPALIMKFRFGSGVIWIAGFYLFAPKPWQEDSPYREKNWYVGSIYYFTQLPIYWFVRKFADLVFVTNDLDANRFSAKRRAKNSVVVIRGGVDNRASAEYLLSSDIVAWKSRKYDACFVGRLHYQKGILELIEIWKLVCDRIPSAKLAIIGIGPLESETRKRISDLGLDGNVEMTGFKDGEEKFDVFRQSKIVVHPATYDSGGMAACEAMAWEIPGISFDLPALRSYYPKGMLKTRCFDLNAFADNVIRLLTDKELYRRTAEEALELAREWDWDKRSDEIIVDVERFSSFLARRPHSATEEIQRNDT